MGPRDDNGSTGREYEIPGIANRQDWLDYSAQSDSGLIEDSIILFLFKCPRLAA